MSPEELASGGQYEDIALAIGLYALEEISLGKAASRLDISKQEMRRILIDAGVDLRLGPQSEEIALEEISVANRIE